MEPRNCHFTNSAHSYYQTKVEAQSVVVDPILSAKSRPFTRVSLGFAGIRRGRVIRYDAARSRARALGFALCCSSVAARSTPVHAHGSWALPGRSASAAARRSYLPAFSSPASTLGFCGPFHCVRDACRRSRHVLPCSATALLAGSGFPLAARCFLLDTHQCDLAAPSCSCARSPLP